MVIAYWLLPGPLPGYPHFDSMHINALFCDKRTSALHVYAFEASTQAEFNVGMQQGYEEACGLFDRFSLEAETMTGDDQVLDQWMEQFELTEPAPTLVGT